MYKENGIRVLCIPRLSDRILDGSDVKKITDTEKKNKIKISPRFPNLITTTISITIVVLVRI